MTNTSKIVEQSKLCRMLCDGIDERVRLHETARVRSSWQQHAGLDTPLSDGARKCQIQSQIVIARRELDKLSKMLND